MVAYKDYREIDIWQKAFALSLMVFDLCKKILSNSVNSVLVNQIIRSATSVAGNIAEGSGASAKREFINYMHIARTSAIETSNWLDYIFAANKVVEKSKM